MALCSSGLNHAQAALPIDVLSFSSAFFQAARSASTAAASGSLFDCTVICDLPGPLARKPISRRPSFFHLPRQYLSFVTDVASNDPFGNHFARPAVAAANNVESFTSTVREMFTANSPERLWLTARMARAFVGHGDHLSPPRSDVQLRVEDLDDRFVISFRGPRLVERREPVIPVLASPGFDRGIGHDRRTRS